MKIEEIEWNKPVIIHSKIKIKGLEQLSEVSLCYSMLELQTMLADDLVEQRLLLSHHYVTSI